MIILNFTYFFYCEDESCGFEQPVHQKDGENILQCLSCFSINSKENKCNYSLKCLACDNTEAIEGNVQFDTENETQCSKCGMSGFIGYTNFDNILFVLDTDTTKIDKCEKCNKTNFKNSEEANFTCPHCFKFLKQKMSLAWSEEEKG